MTGAPEPAGAGAPRVGSRRRRLRERRIGRRLRGFRPALRAQERLGGVDHVYAGSAQGHHGAEHRCAEQDCAEQPARDASAEAASQSLSESLTLDLARDAARVPGENLDRRVPEPLEARGGPGALIGAKLRGAGIAALPAFEVVDPLPAGFLVEPVRDQTEELLLGLFAVSEEAREYGIDRCCVLRLILHRLVHRRIGRRARRKNPSNVLPAALTALPCMRGSSKRMVASGSLSSKNGTGASSGNDQPRWW